MKILNKIISAVLIACVRFYQIFINPVLKVIGGPNSGCRYNPTCSHYFIEAVKVHGALYGSWLGVCRICRCHPWGGFGDDPVPPKKEKKSSAAHITVKK